MSGKVEYADAIRRAGCFHDFIPLTPAEIASQSATTSRVGQHSLAIEQRIHHIENPGMPSFRGRQSKAYL